LKQAYPTCNVLTLADTLPFRRHQGLPLSLIETGVIDVPEQPSDTLIAALLTDLLRTTPYLLYFLLLMITVAACFAAYLILRDRFSKRAKDIADAQKSMAEAVRNNTEAMASAPQII
jgi:hypothetical protein